MAKERNEAIVQYVVSAAQTEALEKQVGRGFSKMGKSLRTQEFMGREDG